MKGYAEFIEEQNEIAIRRKLKLSKAKSERKGRDSKVMISLIITLMWNSMAEQQMMIYMILMIEIMETTT